MTNTSLTIFDHYLIALAGSPLHQALHLKAPESAPRQLTEIAEGLVLQRDKYLSAAPESLTAAQVAARATAVQAEESIAP